MNAIFLDRDGVINEDPGDAKYVTKWRNFKFIKGSKEAIALLTKHDYRIYVISNQRGVSARLFNRADLRTITTNMLSQVKKAGGSIKKVLYCVHSHKEDCDCGKPKTGLFKKAIGKAKIDLRGIYFVGDDKKDIEAGRNLGCKTILVFSGKSRKTDLHSWEFLPDRVALNLLEAVRKVVLGYEQQ